jgi:hypothetical protein
MQRILTFLLCISGGSTALAQGNISAGDPPELRAQRLATVSRTVPEYAMKVKLNPSAPRLIVTGVVHFPSLDRSRSSIEFKLADTMQNLKVSVIAPQRFAGALNVIPEKTPSGMNYLATLPKAIPAGHKLGIRFSYEGGDKPSFTFSMGPKASFADSHGTAWYPQFSEDGNGVGTVSFAVPNGQKVIATGIRDSRNANAFHVTFPAVFAFATADYSQVHVKGTTPVTGYFLRTRESSESNLQRLESVLANLTKEFGAYPYGSFSIVEVPDDQALGFAGSSSAGLILVTSSSLDGPFSLPYYAHELSHQWWGDLVTHAEGDHGRDMLDEGMAQYGSLSTVEALEGSAAAEVYRRTGATFYDPNQSADGYFKMAEAGLDFPLDSLPDRLLSHELADAKGFLVLDLLARTVGRDRFHEALRSITLTNAFGTVTWDQFLNAVQRVSSEKLDWFFEQWFSRTGAPDWHVDWTQEHGQLEIKITQPSPYYRLSLDLLVEGGPYESTVTKISVDGPTSEITLPVNFHVRRVTVDPRYLVVHWTPELRSKSAALATITRANFERVEGNRDAARRDFEGALRSTPTPDEWSVAFRSYIGLARLAMSQRDWATARADFLSALQSPTRPVEELPWAYYRLASVAAQLKEPALLEWAAAGARTADSSLIAPTGAGALAASLLTTQKE